MKPRPSFARMVWKCCLILSDADGVITHSAIFYVRSTLGRGICEYINPYFLLLHLFFCHIKAPASTTRSTASISNRFFLRRNNLYSLFQRTSWSSQPWLGSALSDVLFHRIPLPHLFWRGSSPCVMSWTMHFFLCLLGGAVGGLTLCYSTTYIFSFLDFTSAVSQFRVTLRTFFFLLDLCPSMPYASKVPQLSFATLKGRRQPVFATNPTNEDLFEA